MCLSVEQWMRGEFFKWEYPWARAPRKSSSYGINMGYQCSQVYYLLFCFFSVLWMYWNVLSLWNASVSHRLGGHLCPERQNLCLIPLLCVSWEGIITWSFFKWLSTHSDCMWVLMGCLYVNTHLHMEFQLAMEVPGRKKNIWPQPGRTASVSFPSTSWFWFFPVSKGYMWVLIPKHARSCSFSEWRSPVPMI